MQAVQPDGVVARQDADVFGVNRAVAVHVAVGASVMVKVEQTGLAQPSQRHAPARRAAAVGGIVGKSTLMPQHKGDGGGEGVGERRGRGCHGASVARRRLARNGGGCGVSRAA